jgi:hypothetical protein
MTRRVNWSIAECLLVLPSLFFKTVDPLLIVFFCRKRPGCKSSHRAIFNVRVLGQELDTVLELAFRT